MTRDSGYIHFIRENAPFLATGALLSFLSSFGQTYFISIFGGEIREQYGLSNGDWGLIYMIGTGASAAIMVFAGGLADRFRVRQLGITVILLLGLSCVLMALNPIAALLPLVVFFLRFFGQGMTTQVATVAMARWFVATRGRALAVAAMGYMLAEATLPLLMVWMKSRVDWHFIWLGCALFCLAMAPVLFRLLRLERTPQSVSSSEQSTGLYGKHWTRMDALRHPMFWAMAPAVMSFSGFGTAFWFHQVHFAEIKGWSHLALVAVFPLGTATIFLSTIIYGWAVDRVGAVRLLPFYLIPYIIAFILHWYAPSLGWTALALILMGAAGGGQATLLNACWAEFFGTQHLGSIKAAATALMVLGSALGPGISGWLIDNGVGFEVQMLGYSACFAIAALLLLYPVALMRRSARAT
ncbi:Sugar phosphate permease [Octadecabacter temperatus]|uniref:Major Facilitator Superfamily protein n=1 Tax=Octadecabacter temperatus TaxID=1458307 RepID=A0A0K0YA20_9RHOB|nr:MFS transporter [Octadecabacter temperatus]AKS47732.1 Major Facilitator Superfamily protein [Octadecabacter temperatus]SIO39271.1 Sugar phosphate permease [Octadecabacter temperatus]